MKNSQLPTNHAVLAGGHFILLIDQKTRDFVWTRCDLFEGPPSRCAFCLERTVEVEMTGVDG